MTSIYEGVNAPYHRLASNDANGNATPVDQTHPLPAAQQSSTGTQTSVNAVAADAVVLPANTSRRGAAVYNDSTAVLYLLLANAVASASVYTLQVAAGGYYELPFGYTGVVKGIWASANGNARITELT